MQCCKKPHPSCKASTPPFFSFRFFLFLSCNEFASFIHFMCNLSSQSVYEVRCKKRRLRLRVFVCLCCYYAFGDNCANHKRGRTQIMEKKWRSPELQVNDILSYIVERKIERLRQIMTFSMELCCPRTTQSTVCRCRLHTVHRHQIEDAQLQNDRQIHGSLRQYTPQLCTLTH